MNPFRVVPVIASNASIASIASSRRLTAWMLIVLAPWSGAWAQDATEFTDDFERSEGPLDGDGWTVVSGDWALTGGVVEAGPATVEQYAYIGSPAAAFPPGDFEYSVDLAFGIPDGGPDVGRHAGVMFCMQTPDARGATSGYLVWWIDRGEDRGLTLTRRDGGALTYLVRGSGDPLLEPPENILIEVVGESIQVFADGELVIDAIDDTYRGGHFGLWTYSNASQLVEFDDVSLTIEPVPVTACFEASASIGLVGEAVIFDATCSSSFDGAITSYEWTFGDGGSAEGAVVEHTYDFSDSYLVFLTVTTDTGASDSAELLLDVTESILPFEDSFDVPGPPEEWTVMSGVWDVTLDEQLYVESFEESQVWAGVPPGIIAGDLTIDFTMEFLATPGDGIGRHASVHFFSQEPISRWQTPSYSVWWIDRADDFGVGLHRWDGNNALLELAKSKDTLPGLVEPPTRWTITVEGPRIRVYGDGVLVIDVDDDLVPRSGHLGLWSYSNGQQVLFDDVSIRSGVFPPTVEDVVACATREPTGAVRAGESVIFDAACSVVPDGVEVTDWSWDFGDGESAEGEAVEHTFEFADEYVVTLTVETRDGEGDTRTLIVPVFEVVELPIHETFDHPAGPDVPGWTATEGEWSITEDGSLETITAGTESAIWLGDPPAYIEGDFTAEFTIEFLEHVEPLDAVGKHAAVFFYAREPVSRWDNEAYDVWWIDRELDFGLSIHSWPLTNLTPGSFDFVEDPPSRWRIEVEGESIRVFGDDELIAEALDSTRRGGHFGFWAYLNNQRVRFDDLCIVEGPFSGSPECDDPPPERTFVRGDCNGDGSTSSVTDAVYLLAYNFASGNRPPCFAACDSNGDGSTSSVTDAVYLLAYNFLGGATPPPAPFPECGPGLLAGDEALGCLEQPAGCP